MEEVDETEYWLEIIDEASLSKDRAELARLIIETNEITKIMTKAKSSTYQKNP